MMVAFVSIALLLASPAAAYQGGAVSGGGSVSGTAQYMGNVPSVKPLDITKDQDFCNKTKKFPEDLLVSAGKGLANVVVFIEKIGVGKPIESGTAVLDNTQCHYVPHVQAFAVGTELQVRNSDPVLHNTHIKLPSSDVFNYGLPEKGQVIKKKMTRTGLMKVGCDAGHTWMAAWIAVFDHPYFAVTDADGKFSISDIPPGDYTLVYWHEKLGKQTRKVSIGAGAATEASIQFK